MINKELFFEMLYDSGSHRKQFSRHTGVQKDKDRPTFSVPFDNGLCSHFLAGTGKALKWNPTHNQYYCFLPQKNDIIAVEEWERSQGSRVFIRNLLSSTIALDLNFFDNESGIKTELGVLEQKAKHDADQTAIAALAAKSQETINSIGSFRHADYVCAVPALAEKSFDLPRVLSSRIAGLVGKPDMTGYLAVSNKEQSAKDCSLEEKWRAWEKTTISVDQNYFIDRSVILVDDKYQSGTTMHYIAEKLISAGAKEVHGLVMVKTLRDSDNVDVTET